MRGFLSDGLRDIISAAGLILALIQLVIMFLPSRSSKVESPQNGHNGKPDYINNASFTAAMSRSLKPIYRNAMIVMATVFMGFLIGVPIVWLIRNVPEWVGGFLVMPWGAELACLSYLCGRMYLIPMRSFESTRHKRIWKLLWVFCLAGIFFASLALFRNVNAPITIMAEAFAMQIMALYYTVWFTMFLVAFKVWREMFESFEKGFSAFPGTRMGTAPRKTV